MAQDIASAATTPASQPTAGANQNQQNQPTTGIDRSSNQESNPSPSPVTQAKEQKDTQLYEVKVNGQVRKYTLEQMRAQAELGGAAHEKFQSAAQKEKEYNDWKQQVQKDAISALMDPKLGLSKEQIRTKFESWYKQNFIDPETMSKEELRAVEAERRAQAAEERAKQYETEKEEQQRMEQENQMRQSVQSEIINFLEESGLPKTRFFASRAIYWKRQALAKGYEAPNEVIKNQVKDEFCDVIRTFTKDANDEQLIELLGEDVVKRLRRRDIEHLRKKFNSKDTDNPISALKAGGKRKEAVPMSKVDDYLNSLRRETRSKRS